MGILALSTLIAPLFSRVGADTPFGMNQSAVSIPYEYTYLLPNGFEGNVNRTFVNGTTVPDNSTINDLLHAASQAPFISYDPEFLDIIGPSPEIKLIQERHDDLFAYEAGVWVPCQNQVWFTSSVAQVPAKPPTVYVLDLPTSTVWKLNGTTGDEFANANGGYYFDGKVYFGTYETNTSFRAGVLSIDPQTLHVETIVNSYFGLPLNGPDDLVWARNPRNNDTYMYFADLDFAYEAGASPVPPQMADGVWRWDPQRKLLLPVITRNELDPNGIRVSPDQKILYVTDTRPTFIPSAPFENTGAAMKSWLGPYIYKFDLDEDMFPVNRRVFGYVREGIADGLHIDDAGRVWTGESEGIVVRRKDGKVLGVFNGPWFLQDKLATGLAMANFALAGDVLVVEALNRLWTVKLGKTVVAKDSPIVG